MNSRVLLFVIGLLVLDAGRLRAQDRDTKVRNDRKTFNASKDWIYNDLSEGIRIARASHKPLLVVLRCIPCQACQQFDDDVARRDLIIRDLMDQFVCVRIIQANSLDLSHFQFDFDQSFAIFFMSPDMTIYGRFGTRSDRPEGQDISLVGLRKAMAEALRMHQDETSVRPLLAGKQAKPSPFKTPREYPSLASRYQPELNYAGKVAQSCIHCHQIRDAERRLLRSTDKLIPDEVLYPYPDPDVVGLRMDPEEMTKITRVAPGSSAEHDGFKPGDEITSLDGQLLLSITDVQWVLHNTSATATLPARVRRDGKILDLMMTLRNGWRRGNISWRPTTWELRRLGFGGMKLQAIADDDYRQLGLAQDHMALRAIHVGEYGDHAIAKRAGCQKGDIIVSFDGKNRRMTESELLAYTLQQKRPGDRVDVVIVRDGTRKQLSFTLPK